MRITLKTISQIELSSVLLIFLFSLLSAMPIGTYGYFDLEFEVSNKDKEGKIWTFDQHHLNIINIFPLDQHFRLFTEMEWEHGISLEGGGVGSGKIYLAQGWLEYKKTDFFRIQMGKILVPFGKYGLTYDATPTYLSSFLPTAIYGKHLNSVGQKDRLFAKWLTGVQISGVFKPGEWNIEYFWYITNGRGPAPSEKDNNPNKGLGGRLILNPPTYDARLGFSYYSDTDGSSHNTEQTSIGADFEIILNNITFETEGIYKKGQKIDPTSEKPINDYLTGYGYYFQASYTFNDRWTPFARLDWYDHPDIDEPIRRCETATLGINISLTPRIYFKSEVQRVHEYDRTKAYETFISSVAVAF